MYQFNNEDCLKYSRGGKNEDLNSEDDPGEKATPGFMLACTVRLYYGQQRTTYDP